MNYICKVFILFSMVSFIEANWKFTMKGDYCHKNCILLSMPDYQGYFSTAVFSSEAEKQQGESLLEAQQVPGCSPFGEELILRHLITCREEKRCWKQAGIFEELIPLKWSQSKNLAAYISLWNLQDGLLQIYDIIVVIYSKRRLHIKTWNPERFKTFS